jgi:hypothetical protein
VTLTLRFPSPLDRQNLRLGRPCIERLQSFGQRSVKQSGIMPAHQHDMSWRQTIARCEHIDSDELSRCVNARFRGDRQQHGQIVRHVFRIPARGEPSSTCCKNNIYQSLRLGREGAGA